MVRRLGLAVWMVLLTAAAPWAQAQGVILVPVISGLDQTVFLTGGHDGSNRKFIIEQPGRILVMQPGSVTTTVFLDIASGRVLSGGEQGLLGLAFHPQFSTNRRFFVDYTRKPDGATVIAEFRASAANPNLADPLSELVLLVIPQPYANHNGGMIAFGPDNCLYIGMGDGGSGDDPENHAQDINDLLGKILRIDIDHPVPAGTYSSPTTNPFFGPGPGRDEIYAYGLRNPWRFSFDRVDGQLYVGDVGQVTREEINLVTRGGNYGWRVFEGTLCRNLGPLPCSSVTAVPPLFEFTHFASRCSVTGGYVYRGTQSSLPYGAYVYADFCTGEIFMLQNGSNSLLIDTSLNISSFGEDDAGEIYVIGLGGTIQRISNPGASPQPQRPFSIPDGGGASLRATESGASLTTGYVQIQADPGQALPDGVAIIGRRQGGILVAEASITAAPLLDSGRILATVSGAGTTALALANPGTQPVTVDFYFTSSAGQNLGQGATVIPAGGQVAAFLNDSPFHGNFNLAFEGTFTFTATGGSLAATAFASLANAHSEFLFFTLPIVPLTASSSATAFPHWASGGGWITEFALINPSDQGVSGEVELRTSDGLPYDTLTYTIPARSSRRITSSLVESSPRTGSARVNPLTGATPAGVAVFRLTTPLGAVTETGVPAIAGGTAFRGYGEMSAAVRTGLAVANLSPSSTTVMVEIQALEGGGTIQSGSILLPPSGHESLFLDEISGLTSMLVPFSGMVKVTSPLPIAVTALRSRTNERGDFLITATTPVDESVGVPGTALFFPHFALGAGYEAQFILMDSAAPGGQSGALNFVAPNGQPLPLLVPQE